MRDSRNPSILIGLALAAVALAAESTVSAQQLKPAAPQMPAATATAQQTPDSERGMSITPFMVMGDDFAAGAGVSVVFPLTGRFGLEAEAMADRDAMRTGASLLMNVMRIGRFSTYIAGGAGIQRDESRDLYLGAPFPVYLKKTEFAIGVGGGASVPISSRWSYRADFRWYNPKAEWPESWRISNGLTLHLDPH